MKNTSYILGIVLPAALITFASGCNPSGDREAVSSEKAIDKQIEEVQASASDAADELSAYTYEQKQAFVSTMEAQLEEMENSLEEISESIANSSRAVKAEAEPKLTALKVKMEVLENQLESVKASGSSTWDTVKRSTGETYDDLKDSFNDLRQWLSDKLDT